MKKPTKKELSNWFYYYKWWLVLGLVVLGILLSILWNALGIGQTKTDHYIAYLGSKPLPEQCVTALENALAQLAPDLTGDGKVKVELRQYITEAGSGSSEDVMYGYAAEVRLLADITDGESYVFLVEDPAQFQLDFQILAEADGSMPEEDDFLAEDKVYRWANCPVLAGLALGDYAEQVLQETVTGSCQALLADLYVGRRYYYEESAASHLPENKAFWQILTQGAKYEND